MIIAAVCRIKPEPHGLVLGALNTRGICPRGPINKIYALPMPDLKFPEKGGDTHPELDSCFLVSKFHWAFHSY